MKRSTKAVFHAFLAISIVAAAILLAITAQESEWIQNVVSRYGYAGIFIAAVISGFNLAVPVPIASFIPLFLVSGHALWPVIAVITAGLTFADSLSFYVGKVGRRLLVPEEYSKSLMRLERLQERWKWSPPIALFLFAAFVPLPNEVLVIPLAFLGWRLKTLIPPLLFGNALFNTLLGLGITAFFPGI